MAANDFFQHVFHDGDNPATKDFLAQQLREADEQKAIDQYARLLRAFATTALHAILSSDKQVAFHGVGVAGASAAAFKYADLMIDEYNKRIVIFTEAVRKPPAAAVL